MSDPAEPVGRADLQLITIGRVGVDLYPEQIGVPLAQVRTFAKSLGGSPTNVAVAAARLGHRAAVITKVGNDGFGLYVREALEGFGVDTRFVGTDPHLRTPVVFCEIYPPDRFPLLFYREPKAPDLNITRDELDLDAIARVPILWTTGMALSQEPSRTATLAALAASRGRTIHDLDHRPHAWTDPGAARPAAAKALRHARVVVGNVDEVEMATGERDPDRAAERLLELGPDLAIVKQGPRGTLARTKDERVEVPAVEIEVVNGLGAGDAFGGALVHGLLLGWDLLRTLTFANAAGAIVASRLACADAMPTEREVETLLRGVHV
ncbi:MAG TPA: 5-dehydro-2-deoxygluconokinase [Candidatus Limnocylindria bacterium]|nr:5-dehydro-2-deoxygluconokinase [Candidatus Limnocylindria bacterium]